jgi:putative FmdB family regulatory protein
MPTYEYACDACGNDFEVMQKMSDDPLDSCPKCGKKVRRVLSGGIGISFKGSGFYVNDSSCKSGSSGSCSGCSGK